MGNVNTKIRAEKKIIEIKNEVEEFGVKNEEHRHWENENTRFSNKKKYSVVIFLEIMKNLKLKN